MAVFYKDQDGAQFDEYEVNTLKRRINDIRLTILEQEYRRPPSTALDAKEFVVEILRGLLNSYDPLPDAGFRMLLQSSTQRWKSEICHAVGASSHSDVELVASALGSAIERPKNQYAILVGEGEEYQTEFPSVLDFEDGSCWIQCRLKNKKDGKLLVVTGWDLLKNEDGAWLVDRIQWQDFRDDFRPGVGREEWMMLVD